MNREEFQQEITNRFKNTDSGFGNMTQRELILLQIASNIYHAQINLNLNNANNLLPHTNRLFLVTYKYINRTDAALHEDEIEAKNSAEACNKVCENHNFEVEWHTIKEKFDFKQENKHIKP